MKRFHLTLSLSCGAALALSLGPTLPKAAPPSEQVFEPKAPRSVRAGDLRLRASLDQPVVAGSSVRSLVVEVEGLEPETRDALDIALAIDRSGSMTGPRLQAAQMAAATLGNAMGPEDRVALVSFGSYGSVDAALGAQGLGGAIWALEASGRTALFDGLRMASGLLEDENGPRRVIVLSDGEANVGPTSPYELAAEASRMAQKGISVSAIGLGAGIDHTSLMAIGDAGGGGFDYLSDDQGLDSAFLTELERMRSLSARGVEVDVQTSVGVEVLDVYGYEEFDGHATPRGYNALVGDVSANDVRKVVLRVRIDEDVDEVAARVRVRWAAGQSKAEWLPVHVRHGSQAEARRSEVAWAAAHRDRALRGREMMERSEALRIDGGEEEWDLANHQALEALGYLE